MHDNLKKDRLYKKELSSITDNYNDQSRKLKQNPFGVFGGSPDKRMKFQ